MAAESVQALALRARMVVRCAEGMTNTQVADQVQVRKATAGKWRQRFVDRRLDGLFDELRPGTPRKIGAAGTGHPDWSGDSRIFLGLYPSLLAILSTMIVLPGGRGTDGSTLKLKGQCGVWTLHRPQLFRLNGLSL
jgi:hypothetical protein